MLNAVNSLEIIQVSISNTCTCEQAPGEMPVSVSYPQHGDYAGMTVRKADSKLARPPHGAP